MAVTITVHDTGNMPEHWRQIMLNSMEESAHAWFLKNLELDDIVRVPKCKGKGRVIAISETLLVDMLDGPYYKQRFQLEWSDIARLS